MGRLFDDANNENLFVASAPVTVAPFTISFWCKPDDTNNTGSMCELINSVNPNIYWDVLFRGDTSNRIQFQARSGSTVTAETTNAVTLDAWNHVVCIEAASDDRTVALNGLWGGNEGTNTSAKTCADIDQLSFGYHRDGTPDDPFSGGIAEAIFWDVALTEAEAKALAAGANPYTIRPESIVRHYPLYGATGTAPNYGSVVADLVEFEGVTETTDTVAATDHPPVQSYWGIDLPFVPAAAADGGSTASPSVGSILFTGFASTPTVTDHKSTAPSLGAVSFTGFAPSLSVTENQFISPSLGAVSFAGFAPAVLTTANQAISPSKTAVVFSGFASSVSTTAAQEVSPSLGAVAFSGFAPGISATANHSIVPGLGAVSFTGRAPTQTQFGSFVQATGVNSSGTPIDIAYGSNNTAGNILVAVLRIGNTTLDGGSVSDSQGNTWVRANSIVSPFDHNTELWYALNCAAGANTVTITQTAAATARYSIAEFVGNSGQTTVIPGETNATVGTGTAADSGSITTTIDNSILVGGTTTDTDVTHTATGSFVQRDAQSTVKESLQSRLVNVTGTYNSTTTIGTSDDWTALAVAINDGATAHTVATSSGGIAFTGLVATVSNQEDVVVTPSAVTVDFTGFAPSLSLVVDISREVTQDLSTRNRPGRGPYSFGDLFATRIDAFSVGSRTALPTTGSVTFTGFTPTADVTHSAAPSAGTVVFTGFAPSIISGVNLGVSPSSGAIVFGGFAPTKLVSLSASPSAGTLVFTGFAATITVTTDLFPIVGGIAFTGFAPSVTGGTAQPAVATTKPGVGRRGRQSRKLIKLPDGRITFADDAEIRKLLQFYKVSQAALEASFEEKPTRRQMRRIKNKAIPAPAIIEEMEEEADIQFVLKEIAQLLRS